MNQINIIGRVGSDVELRHTPSGKAVCEINLAVDDGFGENKKTVWVGVTLWGATAECAGRFVRKGDRLGISGRLSQDEWEDKTTGKKQRKTKVTCENMHLLSDKRGDQGQPAPHAAPARREHPQAAQAQATDENHDDDIPF